MASKGRARHRPGRSWNLEPGLLTAGGAASGCWHEAEGALFFLGVVQAKDRVEPVEKSPELDDVLGLDGVVVEVGEEPA